MIYVNGRFLTQTLTGSQRFAYEMLNSLVRNFADGVTVLLPPAPIKESYDVKGFFIKVIGKRTATLWEQIDLPFFLKKNGKPLLINLVNTAPLFYTNQVVSIMDMTTFINPGWFSKSFSLYYKILIPIIAKKSIKVLTISECSKNDIVKFTRINPGKIEILYCSVSDDFLKAVFNEVENRVVLNKFNITPNNYLLAVSSLDPRKNFERLIRSFKNINTDIPLVIVGSQGKVFANKNLKRLFIDAQNVILTGYLTDHEVANLYFSAKCFIYPSLYEGFGMPPLEAMACNCPTIVSNIASLPEVCGNASIYVDPYDTNSISDAIRQIIENDQLRNEMTAIGHDQVKNFSWAASGEKLKEVINELL